MLQKNKKQNKGKEKRLFKVKFAPLYKDSWCAAASLENHILFGEIGAAAGRGAILRHPHGVKCLRNGHNRNTQSERRVRGNFVHLQEYK